MRTALLLLSFFLPLSGAAATSIVVNNFRFDLPDGYNRLEIDETVLYARKGPGPALLKKFSLDRTFDEDFFDDWFFGGAIAYLMVRTQPIKDEDDSANSAIEYLQEYWGSSSFVCPGDSEGVVHFINTAGAFVFVSMVERNEHLLIVESMDLVHALVAENTPNTDDKTELCHHFSRAANFKDALSVLLSGRFENDA